MFLDLKLHDIGNTVTKGVESVAQMGATFLTVHAYPQTMKAAVEGKRGSSLRILAVTVLTSYDDADLAAAGYDLGVGELAAARAGQARDIGVDGLVCSAEEAANLRKIVGPGMVLVTPGIRPAGSATGDQKRIMTPAKAIQAGADYLVVGRPIVEAGDPKAAAERDRRRDRTSTKLDGEGDMAKGYWIAFVEVKNPDGYKNEYVAALPDVLRKFGGRYVTRGGQTSIVEGSAKSRAVILEFPELSGGDGLLQVAGIRQSQSAAQCPCRERLDRDRGL